MNKITSDIAKGTIHIWASSENELLFCSLGRDENYHKERMRNLRQKQDQTLFEIKLKNEGNFLVARESFKIKDQLWDIVVERETESILEILKQPAKNLLYSILFVFLSFLGFLGISYNLKKKVDDLNKNLGKKVEKSTEKLKKKNVELKDSEEQLRTITSSANDAIIMIDNEGKVSYWNPAAEKIFGFSSSELMNRDLSEFIIPKKYREMHNNGLLTFKETGEGPVVGNSVELEGLRKNGEEFPVELSLSSIKIKDRWHAVGILRDITERKRSAEAIQKAKDEIENKAKELEESNRQLKETAVQLVQSAKLSSLGEMTAGIAHEMNQPLNNINLTAQALLMDMERNAFSEQGVKVDLQDISDEIKRMSGIIDHMRTFTRKSDDNYREKIDINGVIEGVFKLLGQQLKVHNFEVKKELDPNLPEVLADQGKLGQVFTNLIVNARDAIEDFRETERKIEIKSYQTRLSRSQIGLPPSQETQKFSAIKNTKMPLNQLNQKEENQTLEIIVEVKDNGGGISDEIKGRILEPFFTTKAPGKGTGLGLSIVDRLVKEHQGRIEVESRVGEGSLFRVILPVGE